MSELGQTPRLSCPGMSASPPTSDVSLRASEPTLRANRVIFQCRKTASLFAPAHMRDVTDLQIEA